MRFTVADYTSYEEALDMGTAYLERWGTECELMEPETALEEELWEATLRNIRAAMEELMRRQEALDALIAARPREWEGLLSQMEVVCHA